MPIEKPTMYTPARFHEYVEILESCEASLQNPKPVNVRISIILLDNLAEVLMFQKCIRILRQDEAKKNLLQEPRYDSNRRSKVLGDFNEKVSFLASKEKLISTTDAAVLRIGHSYRNALFHRDESNPPSHEIIARHLFASVCAVFVAVYDQRLSITGAITDLEWLDSYNLPTNRLDFYSASRSICAKLRSRLDTTLELTEGALREDLEERFRAIDGLLQEDFFRLLNVPLDSALLLSEFESSFIEDGNTEDYWQARYSLGQGNSTSDRERFEELSAAYNERRREALKQFKPSVTMGEMDRIRKSLPRLEQHKSISSLLQRYQQIDEALTAFEELLYTVAVSLSEAYETGVEMAREEACERRLAQAKRGNDV